MIDYPQAKARLRAAIEKSPLLFPLYYRLRWSPRTPIERALHEYGRRNEEVFFVQVGANDAFHGDPFNCIIRGNRWRGVFVEPQVEVFRKLKANLSAFPGLRFENAAVAPTTGTRPLYKIAFSTDRWASGLASFDRRCVEAHFESGYLHEQARAAGVQVPVEKDEWIAVEEVRTLNFADLMERHAIRRLDVLLVDTEGFDYEILRLIDFSSVRPAVIVYEHAHLSEDDTARAEALLRGRAYRVTRFKNDTLALREPEESA